MEQNIRTPRENYYFVKSKISKIEEKETKSKRLENMEEMYEIDTKENALKKSLSPEYEKRREYK